MSENAERLFIAFQRETPDYDPHHIEVYIQWLADKVDDYRAEVERLRAALEARTEEQIGRALRGIYLWNRAHGINGSERNAAYDLIIRDALEHNNNEAHSQHEGGE